MESVYRRDPELRHKQKGSGGIDTVGQDIGGVPGDAISDGADAVGGAAVDVVDGAADVV